VRRLAAAAGRHSLTARGCGPAANRPDRLAHGTERARRLWSPCGVRLARSATSDQAMRCGESGGDSSRRKRGSCRARRNRRRCDDGAEEAARDGGVPVGEAAPAVGGGLGVLWPEMEARGAAVGALEWGEKKRARGRGGGDKNRPAGGGSVLKGQWGRHATRGRAWLLALTAACLCFGSGAPTRLMHGPRLSGGRGARSGARARVGRPGETRSGPCPG
jgi:hypothetical protein